MLNNPEFKGKTTKEFKTYLDDNDNGNVNPVVGCCQRSPAVENYIGFCVHEKNEAQKLLSLQKQLREPGQHSRKKDLQLLLQMRPLKQEIDKTYCDEVEKTFQVYKTEIL